MLCAARNYELDAADQSVISDDLPLVSTAQPQVASRNPISQNELLRRCFHAVPRIDEHWEYSAEKDDDNLGRNADTQPDDDQRQ